MTYSTKAQKTILYIACEFTIRVKENCEWRCDAVEVLNRKL